MQIKGTCRVKRRASHVERVLAGLPLGPASTPSTCGAACFRGYVSLNHLENVARVSREVTIGPHPEDILPGVDAASQPD
eukprot:228591-Prorocentrum_minimum.AAC.3